MESNWIRMKLGKTEAGTKTTDDISQSGRNARKHVERLGGGDVRSVGK